jgi:amidase
MAHVARLPSWTTLRALAQWCGATMTPRWPAAAALDAETVAHPWAGAFVTVKDWIDVAGMPCEGASSERTGRVPQRDATVVDRLRAAGAIVIAKTQPGADHAIHGRCHHPLDVERTPGGSSSGEAALLGCGASALGLGSDSGGSIRLPAAWCGVVGLKPSLGLVPITGHFPRLGGRNDGRTVIGPMARRVADLTAMLSVIAGPDGCDPDCVPIEIAHPASVLAHGLRVAITDDASWQPASSTGDAVGRAVDVLVRLGAVVVEDALPTHLDESLDITERYWRRAALSGADADRQLRDWDRFSARLTRAASGFDIVLGPVVADVAPLARPLTGEDYVFTLPWSLTGWPAISVPAGNDARTGLPLAVQLAAPRWHEHVVLAAASWLEAHRSEATTQQP